MIDAKKYLESLQASEDKVRLKIQQLQVLKDKVLCITVPVDAELVSHTKNVGTMAETIAAMIDMQKEIDIQSCKLLEAKREAFHLLDQIRPESASIIINRFFVRLSIQEMSKMAYMSRRNTYRRLQEALSEFQHVLNGSGQDSPCLTE